MENKSRDNRSNSFTQFFHRNIFGKFLCDNLEFVLYCSIPQYLLMYGFSWIWPFNSLKLIRAPQLDILLSILRPRQKRHHFADDIFKRNFLNENVWIPIKSSLKFVPQGPINNIPALVQIMSWRRTGDRPLSEPMMTHFSDAYMRHSASSSYQHTRKFSSNLVPHTVNWKKE